MGDLGPVPVVGKIGRGDVDARAPLPGAGGAALGDLGVCVCVCKPIASGTSQFTSVEFPMGPHAFGFSLFTFLHVSSSHRNGLLPPALQAAPRPKALLEPIREELGLDRHPLRRNLLLW
jgi:hypothetical protein